MYKTSESPKVPFSILVHLDIIEPFLTKFQGSMRTVKGFSGRYPYIEEISMIEGQWSLANEPKVWRLSTLTGDSLTVSDAMADISFFRKHTSWGGQSLAPLEIDALVNAKYPFSSKQYAFLGNYCILIAGKRYIEISETTLGRLSWTKKLQIFARWNPPVPRWSVYIWRRSDFEVLATVQIL